MARFTKFAFVLMAAISFNVSTPATSEAGLIPWAYDAIFGPVGSMRSYGPTYTASAYRGYGTVYSAYVPMSPTTVAYTPVTASYWSAPSSCGCSQAANYAPAYNSGCCTAGCCNSGCCPTGGCSSGTCSNCSTGTSSSSYPITPSVDPKYNSNYNGRETLEERLRRLEYEHEQHGRFLKDKHDFELQPYGSSSFNGTKVPARQSPTTRQLPSNSNTEPNFQDPLLRSRRPGLDPLEEEERREERRKPELSTPAPNEKSGADKKDDAPAPKPEASHIESPSLPKEANEPSAKEADVQSLRLREGLAARAVAPRQRMQTANRATTNSVAAKSVKNAAKTVLDSSISDSISRH